MEAGLSPFVILFFPIFVMLSMIGLYHLGVRLSSSRGIRFWIARMFLSLERRGLFEKNEDESELMV
jgi:hypothetical protein